MLRRIRSRITPSGVIATIALFAALGGGYAAAFKGSGTLQKAAKNVQSQVFQDVRTLNGFGALQARCDPGDEEVEYAIRNNTSSGELVAHSVRWPGGAFFEDVIDHGETKPLSLGSGTSGGVVRIHLWKTSTAKKQVDIVASNSGPFPVVLCETGALVRVMALNTVE